MTRRASLLASVRTALGARRALGVAFVTGSVMHAAGHALLAGAAGMLARALAGGSGVAGRGLARVALGSTNGAVLVVAAAGVVAALVKLVGGALSSWGEARIAGEVGGAVRLAVLDDVLAVDPRQPSHGAPELTPAADRAGTRADRLAALTSHVQDVERGVAQGVLGEARAIAGLVPLGVLLVVLAPRLAGSAVAALGGFGVLAFALRRAFKRAHVRASASTAHLVEAADEAVRHAEVWATYGATRRIRAHVARVGRAMTTEAAAIRVRASLLSSTSEVLGALALLLVLLLAARGALGVDHGTVVPFAIVFFMAYKPLRDLVDARLARARGEEALNAALAHTSPEPRARPLVGASRPWSLSPLVLDGVLTPHGTHPPLTITIPAGAIVAVVGPTGTGKTSLLRALLGLSPLRSGTVHWGDRRVDLAGVGPGERPFAWVPQDAPIVGDTLAINVGLGRADDDGSIPDPAPVLGRLGAESLVGALGDATLATMRAVSGGERQWIAVARALASGLPVLLLDEPTSALDPLAQAKLLAAIAKLRGTVTVLLVTHRPEPIAIADVVIELAGAQGGVSTSSTGPGVTSTASAR